MKEEIENLNYMRKYEERLNNFISGFYQGRDNAQRQRKYIESTLKVKDCKIQMKMSPLFT
jgi:hypothetical protein